MSADALLSYATQPAAQLSLEEFDGGAQLTFPIPARWIGRLMITIWCFTATMYTLGAVFSVWEWWRFQQVIVVNGILHPAPREGHWLLEIMIPFVPPIIYWLVCVHLIRSTRKQSLNPETWTATQNELTIWRYTIFGLRRRIYLATDVKSVKTTPVADLLRRKNIVDLTVRFKDGRRRVMRRISAKNSALAVRAAAAFRKALNLREETK